MRIKFDEIDMSNVGFEDMIKLISDGELCGYYKTPHKTYKFYGEGDDYVHDCDTGIRLTPDIKIHVDDMDLTFGEFFDEYEYISDWISYRFIVKKPEVENETRTLG